eukprot:350252-Chlamydomonas_euryale.AAC.2
MAPALAQAPALLMISLTSARSNTAGQTRLVKHGWSNTAKTFRRHHQPRNFHHAMPTTPHVSRLRSPSSAPRPSTSGMLWYPDA